MENKQLPYDVFISHSSRDSLTASGMKQALQNKGIRCWKAPDDILPGESWPSAIMRAISSCRVMILVWTENAMSSSEVSKELTLAMRYKLVLVPYRIDNVQPIGDWEYHLANTHWMDATSDIIDKDYHALGDFLLKLLPERGNAIDPPVRKLTPEDLEQFIEQALSDGVLTEYERSQLMKDAITLGWKRDDFSSELDSRLARKLQVMGIQTPTPTPPKFSPTQSTPPPPPLPENANSDHASEIHHRSTRLPTNQPIMPASGRNKAKLVLMAFLWSGAFYLGGFFLLGIIIALFSGDSNSMGDGESVIFGLVCLVIIFLVPIAAIRLSIKGKLPGTR